MRKFWLVPLLAAASGAHAEDHVVNALSGPVRFEPAELVIAVGDTVTFKNVSGFHNAASDPGAVTQFRCASGCDGDVGGNGNASASQWTATVAFPAAGDVPYRCEIHGNGMLGNITVIGDDAVYEDGFEDPN